MIITQAQHSIRNQLFTDVIQNLQLPCPCDISQYALEIRGNIHNGRGHYDIRVLGCAYELFHGPHLVAIGEHGQPFWVQSLTSFKKNFFGFVDHLSFERSVFVKFQNSLIRLKNIRFIVTLPRYALDENTLVYKSPTTTIRYKEKHAHDPSGAPSESSSKSNHRTTLMLKHCVQKLLSAYARECTSKFECVQKLTNDFASECAAVAHSMDHTFQRQLSPVMEENTQDVQIEMQDDDVDIEKFILGCNEL